MKTKAKHSDFAIFVFVMIYHTHFWNLLFQGLKHVSNALTQGTFPQSLIFTCFSLFHHG